jgi:hypothetical protein
VHRGHRGGGGELRWGATEAPSRRGGDALERHGGLWQVQGDCVGAGTGVGAEAGDGAPGGAG